MTIDGHGLGTGIDELSWGCRRSSKASRSPSFHSYRPALQQASIRLMSLPALLKILHNLVRPMGPLSTSSTCPYSFFASASDPFIASIAAHQSQTPSAAIYALQCQKTGLVGHMPLSAAQHSKLPLTTPAQTVQLCKRLTRP